MGATETPKAKATVLAAVAPWLASMPNTGLAPEGGSPVNLLPGAARPGRRAGSAHRLPNARLAREQGLSSEIGVPRHRRGGPGRGGGHVGHPFAVWSFHRLRAPGGFDDFAPGCTPR